MQNYFNYFTEIEERFQQRRGSLLLLSTLDWALIETWREAGVPLAAVLRGIDDAFDRHEARKVQTRARRVNGLGWCAQAVMEAAEQMREASVGMAEEAPSPETGFETGAVAEHLGRCSDELEQAGPTLPPGATQLATETAARLRALACAPQPDTEQMEQTLRTLEEKLLAMLLACTPEVELAAMRAGAAQAVAPYKRRMQAAQIRQVETQFVEKRLLERYAVPRLSLFYMQGVA